MNESVLNRNVYLSSSNTNDKDITNEKNGSKTEITIRGDCSDKRKDSVHADQVLHNEPGDSLIVSNQDSNKNTHNSSNNIVFFGDSIPKGINVKKLKSQSTLQSNCSCRFFCCATSKHFHHYIRPTLNETDMIKDIAALHIATSNIIN